MVQQRQHEHPKKVPATQVKNQAHQNPSMTGTHDVLSLGIGHE